LTGVNAVALNDEARRRLGIDPRVTGLIVTEIDPKSPYAEVLATDMIVMEINRAAVPTLAAARALLQKGRNLFYVYHNGSAGFLVVIVK
jgi:serine protease Do/serine protease DegQ